MEVVVGQRSESPKVWSKFLTLPTCTAIEVPKESPWQLRDATKLQTLLFQLRSQEPLFLFYLSMFQSVSGAK